jgi:hypothetical protein
MDQKLLDRWSRKEVQLLTSDFAPGIAAIPARMLSREPLAIRECRITQHRFQGSLPE